MNIRHKLEERESEQLSVYASQSSKTKGRAKKEQPSEVRTEYQRDRDRVIHSKSFRRLKQKTQVFIAPTGDHYRTRLTHTLEVAQIARTVAKALSLNEDLTEAIALAHDLGHTPFGHAGEQALNQMLEPYGLTFRHNEQSLRVVEILEPMNLTWEVRDGIRHHTGAEDPSTLEGCIVKIADRIGYINHDIDDAIRGGIINDFDLPKECLTVLGQTHSRRINAMVTDMIKESWDKPKIQMSATIWEAMNTLRDFLFKNVYVGSEAKIEEIRAKELIKRLFELYMEKPELILEISTNHLSALQLAQTVSDYIAGMTDRYAIKVYSENFLPKPWLA